MLNPTKAFLFLALVLISITNHAFSQSNNEYKALVKEAEKLYKGKEYLKAGQKYAEAFKADGNKGLINDRYNAACSWALASMPDPAFEELYMIANKGKFSEYDFLLADSDFENLYSDERWTEIKEIVKTNKEKAEANFDMKLKAELEMMYNDDQKYREQLSDTAEKYGWVTGEVDSLEKELKPIIRYTDSINQQKLTRILETYGWLGPEVVGEIGNSTFFAVIQHSELEYQEKYLPLMREAVQNGKARADHLALVEDRVALRQGRKQIYGSQFSQDPVTKEVFVSPLEDPDNVDIRRAKVGLPPLQEYIDMYELKWDPEQYKKDLPAYEAIERAKQK